MKVIKIAALGLLISVLHIGSVSAQAIAPIPTATETSIQDSANTWLALVDKGQFKDSWTSGADSLQKGIDQAKWNDTLTQVRSSSGALIGRSIKDGSYTQEFFSKRSIQVVVLHFTSKFENKPNATETLIMLPSSDGKWHVSGYLLK